MCLTRLTVIVKTVHFFGRYSDQNHMRNILYGPFLFTALVATLLTTETKADIFVDDDVKQGSINDPLPDMTLRTNSQDCIDRYQDLYTLAGQYFTALPSSTNIKRIDILSGGVPSTAGFTALPLGRQHQTEYYSLRSTYGTADASVAGIQSILREALNPSSATVQSLLTLTRTDGYRIYLGSRHHSCLNTEKASDLEVLIQKGPTDFLSASTTTPKCELKLVFSSSDQKNLCGDSTKTGTIASHLATIRAAIAAKTIFFQAGDTIITPAQAAEDLEGKITALGDTFGYTNVWIIDDGSYGVYCDTGYEAYNWDYSWTRLQQAQNQNRNGLKRLQRLAIAKQATLDFIDGITSNLLQSLSFATACSKVKRD